MLTMNTVRRLSTLLGLAGAALTLYHAVMIPLELKHIAPMVLIALAAGLALYVDTRLRAEPQDAPAPH